MLANERTNKQNMEPIQPKGLPFLCVIPFLGKRKTKSLKNRKINFQSVTRKRHKDFFKLRSTFKESVSHHYEGYLKERVVCISCFSSLRQRAVCACSIRRLHKVFLLQEPQLEFQTQRFTWNFPPRFFRIK